MTGPIKVIDLELSSPVTDMGGLHGYTSVQALIRLHGRPFGYVTLPVTGGCCRATVIIEGIRTALQQQLVQKGLVPGPSGLSCHETPEGWVMDGMPVVPAREDEGPYPLVTLAVCTRNRSRNLRGCLEAIQCVTYPFLDILLIDNAPLTDAAEKLIKREFPHVRYLIEPRPGLDWARNRAIMAARGEILAFTDDDVVVDPGWIQAIVSVFAEDPDVMAVTGLVVPYELETEAQILFEAYGGFGKGFERRRFPFDNGTRPHCRSHMAAGDLGTGANMAFRRFIFDIIGGFDPALDTGTVTCGGGDLEIFFRLIQEGYTLVYEPRAIVRHIHRREFEALKAQIKSWGTAFVAYLIRSVVAYPKNRFAISCFTLRWLVGRHLIRIIKNLRGSKRILIDLMLAELSGSLMGLFAYHKSRRAAEKVEATFQRATPESRL
ncbi:MAG: glycosyltransferase [Deltaproteobacteria bacterium]|nr:glycosyltransferase [Deltaproteobacteria bacterium]